MLDNGEEEQEEGLPEWLATFADLSLLLLVFFILLFSLSSLEVKRFSETFASVRTAFGGKANTDPITSQIRAQESTVLETIKLQKQIMQSQEKVYSEITTYLTQNGVEGVVGAVFDEGIITLTVPSEVLFTPGSTELSAGAKNVLDSLLEIFIKRKNQMINIRGYTDSSPTRSGSRDNWEISSLRAVNVLRFFLSKGIPANRMTATGLGDTNPLYPNTTPENMAKNRRIEFILERRVTK